MFFAMEIPIFYPSKANAGISIPDFLLCTDFFLAERSIPLYKGRVLVLYRLWADPVQSGYLNFGALFELSRKKQTL